jgi:hypothetical protein
MRRVGEITLVGWAKGEPEIPERDTDYPGVRIATPIRIDEMNVEPAVNWLKNLGPEVSRNVRLEE